jgi:hypothetical protein
VRASLAAQALLRSNLPALLSALSPPGLKDFLLMQPPDDLGLLVCTNVQLVQAAEAAAIATAKEASAKQALFYFYNSDDDLYDFNYCYDSDDFYGSEVDYDS